MSTTTIIIIIVVIIVIFILLIGGGIGIWYFFFRNRNSTAGVPPKPVGSLVEKRGPYSRDDSPVIDDKVAGSIVATVPSGQTTYCNGKFYGHYGYATARVAAGTLAKDSSSRSEIVWMTDPVSYLIWDKDQTPLENKIGYSFEIPKQTDATLASGNNTIVYYLYVKKSLSKTDSTTIAPLLVGVASSVTSGNTLVTIDETFGFTEGKPSVCAT